MKIETIITSQGHVEYSITGKGKSVLFIHGGHSNCRETLFHKGFDQNKFQLITPSRPGYGNTPLNIKRTPKKTAELIISLLDSLHIDQVIVYAISAGGLTAIEFASNYPERVDKLILASAVSRKWLVENGKIYKTAKMMFNPFSEKFVWGLIRLLSRAFPRVVANNFYPQFSTNSLHKLGKNDIKELMLTFKNFHSKSGFMSDIGHQVESDLISKIKCPTLVIHSKNDSSVPFEHAEYAHEKIKNSVLSELDNEWGHLFWIGNDSKDSIQKTIEFIEQQ